LVLQKEEKSRNKIMIDIIYVYERHPLAAQIAQLYRLYAQLQMLGQPYCIPINAAYR